MEATNPPSSIYGVELTKIRADTVIVMQPVDQQQPNGLVPADLGGLHPGGCHWRAEHVIGQTRRLPRVVRGSDHPPGVWIDRNHLSTRLVHPAAGRAPRLPTPPWNDPNRVAPRFTPESCHRGCSAGDGEGAPPDVCGNGVVEPGGGAEDGAGAAGGGHSGNRGGLSSNAGWSEHQISRGVRPATIAAHWCAAR